MLEFFLFIFFTFAGGHYESIFPFYPPRKNRAKLGAFLLIFFFFTVANLHATTFEEFVSSYEQLDQVPIKQADSICFTLIEQAITTAGQEASWNTLSIEEQKVIAYYSCQGSIFDYSVRLVNLLLATKNASETAITQTTNNFDAEYMTRGDAFRHSLWNALLTKSVQNSFDNLWDPDQATQMGAIQYALNFTFAHEAGRYREALEAGALPDALENLNNDNEMDRHNNIEGLRFALYDFCTQNGDSFSCQGEGVAIDFLQEMAMGKYSARWVDGTESYPTVASTMKKFDNSFVFTTCHAFDDGGDCDRDFLYDIWAPGGIPFGIRAPDKCVHLPAPIWQLNHMFDRNCDSVFDSWVLELLPPTVGIFPPHALDNIELKLVDFITIGDSGEVVVLKKDIRPDTYNVIVQDNVFMSVEKRANGFVLFNDETGAELPVYNYSEQFFGGSSTVINENIYIINESTNSLLALIPERADGSQIIISYTTYSINNVPILTEREIHNVNGELYLTGYSNNALNIYLLDTNGFTFMASIPLKRRAYNITVVGESLYIVDGVAINQNGEYYYDQSKMTDDGGEFVAGVVFNTTNNETELIETQSRITTSVAKIRLIGNTLHLAYRLDFDSNSYLEENVDIQSGLISYQYYTIGEEYCLSQNGSTVSGGYLQEDVCQPFTEALFSSIVIGNTVHAVEGLENRLIVGAGSDVKIYDITEPLAPQLLHTQSVYGPAADMVMHNNKVIIAVENGVDTIELDTYAYIHHPTYGTSKTLTLYNEKLYVGDGQGLKVLNPNTLDILQQVNTSGDVTKLKILDGVLYTFEWSGLKRFDVDTLTSIPTDYYYVYNPELLEYDGNLYISKNSNIVRLTFNGTTVIEEVLIGDSVELRSNYGYGDYTYFPDGTTLRVSTMEEIPEPVCGNGVIEDGETCDGNTVACTTLSGDYISGDATCNSTCNGYNESSCEEDDGW